MADRHDARLACPLLRSSAMADADDYDSPWKESIEVYFEVMRQKELFS